MKIYDRGRPSSMCCRKKRVPDALLTKHPSSAPLLQATAAPQKGDRNVSRGPWCEHAHPPLNSYGRLTVSSYKDSPARGYVLIGNIISTFRETKSRYFSCLMGNCFQNL